ncbi:hypothetical protein B0A55_03874 [Friedmanniomyces simplex]|uniref:Autophagy-related protein 101 n=1 Tax=Friedmanniomyces simplex TaxID=329884 RepID=A0A4U0XMP0_9PEZI|nr:hypothetical protein B0A55_03874 [Friedmanniomyces simplex]
MDTRKPPEFTLELVADRSNVKDVVKGLVHTIFFHRYFTPLTPATHDVLDTTLPYVSEDDIEDLIETRATAFVRSLDTATSTQHTSPQYSAKSTTAATSRGTLAVKFLEKKRRKGWFIAKADEETVWETWVLEVTLTSARSEPEAARNRRVMEGSLQEAAMKVVAVVNREKGHIPPITTNESNPFPYQIVVNPKNG